MRTSSRCPRRSAFTLLELVIVVSLISILAGALAPSLKRQARRSRDARRLKDIQAVAEAIDSFYAEHGRWPEASTRSSGGWDVSHDGDFIPELRRAGYLLEDARDPINDDGAHYRYFVYPRGSYGCDGQATFYVLGIWNFESESFESQHQGYFACDGRDWGEEFDFVTGGGATY